MSDKHAQFGGSNASRWMGCPGSTRAIAEAAPRPQKKEAADHGKAAHHIGEWSLKGDTVPERWADQWISADGQLERSRRKPTTPGAWFKVDAEMIDGVGLYVATVREQLASLPGSQLMVEVPVFPLAHRRRIMWGTSDAIVLEPWGRMIVTDLKYGRGVVVEPEYNDQGMFYGLGAMNVAGGAADVSDVTITIVQPRANHARGPVREWSTSPQVLSGFAAQIDAAVDLALTPDAPLIPGPHCRFCPVELDCPALKALIKAETGVALTDVSDDLQVGEVQLLLPDRNNAQQILRAKAFTNILRSYIKRVDEMMYDAAERKLVGLGYKLAARLGNRQYVDEDAVVAELRAMGLTDSEIFKTVINSPAQLEKNKKVGKKWMADKTFRAEGEPTLVPDSDPRAAAGTSFDLLTAVVD